MPTTLPGVPPGEAAVQLRAAGPRDRPVRRGRHGVRQGRPRDDGHRSSAVTRWPRPPSALRRARSGPDGRAQRWYSSWRAGPLVASGSPGLARGDAAHDTAELVEKLDSRGAPARLDQRLDRAGARAHGHDGDRRAHAGGHPRRRARPGTAGCARDRAAADRDANVPGTRSAVFESLGGEPWPRFDADPAALKRHRRRPRSWSSPTTV